MRMMANSTKAFEAYETVSALQDRFAKGLNALSDRFGEGKPAVLKEWLRDEGTHGGGMRYEVTDATLFNRGSINISQVHYDDMPKKRLGSATAISTIIHPKTPFAPSVHMHISWTEMKHGEGYWRLMADLNPSVPAEKEKNLFEYMLRQVTGEHFRKGKEAGDRYFYIPALGRTRGVSHFYLEGFNSGNFEKDRLFAERFGNTVIDTYLSIVEKVFENAETVDDESAQRQLAYHTLYFFQVLTLDRGTTSGLLVHDQNDIGIMGSLPSHVDKRLLREWKEKVPSVQQHLVDALIEALPEGDVVYVDESVKRRLADAVRNHYMSRPEALEMQTRGDIVPPTVDNHR